MICFYLSLLHCIGWIYVNCNNCKNASHAKGFSQRGPENLYTLTIWVTIAKVYIFSRPQFIYTHGIFSETPIPMLLVFSSFFYCISLLRRSVLLRIIKTSQFLIDVSIVLGNDVSKGHILWLEVVDHHQIWWFVDVCITQLKSSKANTYHVIFWQHKDRILAKSWNFYHGFCKKVDS